MVAVNSSFLDFVRLVNGYPLDDHKTVDQEKEE